MNYYLLSLKSAINYCLVYNNRLYIFYFENEHWDKF